MRYAIAFLALGAAATANAEAPRDVVFGYECAQIDPEVTGFSCEFNGFSKTVMSWHEDPRKMNAQRQTRAKYEFERLALRYFSLGGQRFEVRRADGKKLGCFNSRNHPNIDYTCQEGF